MCIRDSGGKFLKVNSTPDAVEFASFALSDIPSGGASTGQVLKWSGTAWTPGTDNTGSGGGGGGGGSSTGTLGVYNATGDAKVMIETDGSNASDVAKLVLQKGTDVANLSWNGTTLEVDKPLSLGSSLTASSANSDVLLVGSGTGYQVKRSVALSSLLTTSSSVTNVGTLTSLTVSGDATFDTSTLKVDSTNNRVGIGTTSPDDNLHINGGSSSTYLTISGGGSGNDYKKFKFGATAAANRIYSYRENGTFGTVPLYFNVTSGSDPDVVINDTGNVGIGTTSPLGTLHIQVSEQYENGLFISSSHGTYGSDSDGGVYHFNHYNHATSTRRGLLMQERNTTGVFKRNIMIFQRGTGNVGIGSGSNGFIEPSHKLDVNGTGRFTGDLTAGANLTVTGNLTVNGTTTLLVLLIW